MKRNLVEYLYIVLGTLLAAVALVYLINPARIAAGGVSGIATILYHTIGWNIGYVIFALSVPLFLTGMKIFGKVYGFKSFLGSFLLSAFTAALSLISGNEGILDYGDPVSMLLSAIFGGVVMGAGIGFVMRAGANTGGTDIIAQIINRYTRLSLGTSLTLVDALIILASAFVFGIESAMYAIITVYITGIAIDKVAMPFSANTAKTVMIITSETEQVRDVILKEMDHGATLIPARGMYTGIDRPIIMTVISNNKLGYLTNRVKEIDSDAFMIVQNASQVMGEGFMPFAKAVNMHFGS